MSTKEISDYCFTLYIEFIIVRLIVIYKFSNKIALYRHIFSKTFKTSKIYYPPNFLINNTPKDANKKNENYTQQFYKHLHKLHLN